MSLALSFLLLQGHQLSSGFLEFGWIYNKYLQNHIFDIRRGCDIILAPKTYLSIVNFNKMQILFTEEAEINLWREAKTRYIEKFNIYKVDAIWPIFINI